MNRFFSLPQFIGLIATTVLLLTYKWLEYAPYFALFVILLLVTQFIYIASIENQKKAFNSFKLELNKNINNPKWLQNKKDELKEQLTLKVGNAQINRLKLEKVESILSSGSSNKIGKTSSNDEVIVLNKRISELEKEIDNHNRNLDTQILIKPLRIKDKKQNDVVKIMDLMYKIGLFEGTEKDVMETIGACCNCKFTNFANRIGNHKDRTSDEVQAECIIQINKAFETYYGIKIEK